MTDDGGVLGNLPNSRPGKRSAKRDAGAGSPAKSAAKAAAKAEKKGAPAARASSKSRISAKPGAGAAGAASPRGASRKRTAAVKEPGSGDRVVVEHDIGAQVRHDPVPPPPTEDPVGAVVRTGLGVAGASIKVAGAVGREIFRRLPRP
jgi:hypothetical protein